MRLPLLASFMMLAISTAPAFAAAQHDVPWYVANPQQLQAELSACQADPGDLTNSPDCVNAAAAEQQIILFKI